MKKLQLFICFLVWLPSASTAQSNETGAGISLAFDGSPGNYADLGDVYNNLSFPLLFEAWIKPLDYSSGGAIFASDNDTVAEQGFRVSLTESGNLMVEFGNGQGTGPEYRRGFVTNWTIPLNSWTHIAVSCKSASIVTIYISGVSRTLQSTDGTSISEVISHSSAPASIGRISTSSGTTWFNGEIDEIRLWKKSKSQLQIRDYMCVKHATVPSDLIGYWNMDESYSANTIADKAGTPETGTIAGNFSRVMSGAALGNAAKAKFTSNWFDVKVTLYSPSGDKMLTQEISGDGIVVYYVDGPPVLSDGLELSPTYYFGVYCVKGTGNAGYNMRYKYNGNNGVVNQENELLVQFMSRKDDTDAPWINLNGANDTADNWISQHDGVSLRGEYTISIPGSEKLTIAVQNTNEENILLFPNPASHQFRISMADHSQMIKSLQILNESGMILKQISQPPSESLTVEANGLADGIYLLDINTTSGHVMKKIVIRH